ncbi:DEKNAAC105017 [Brettanomyces naardenensis]|uniref:DEKNAAC105017 n=1 Tax=Brettanomyces naardenensis TaxID=13370 RepID=A0A448YS09_BRENA|nr:DEKNAAC105017 [Brettanomyces naardenensis]
MITYQELLPIGSLLLISTCSFLLGTFFANWPYDYYTLWNTTGGEEYFAKALEHYKVLASQPNVIVCTFAGISIVGFVGAFIKIFRPTEDTKYFEYGSLAALVASVCIYLTNVRTGEMSALVGQWGDVDQNTGLSVIGASSVMIVFLLLGVVVLQSGLFYAEYVDYKAKVDYYLKNLGHQLQEAEKINLEKSATSKSKKTKAVPNTTGSSSKETTAKSRRT